MLKPIRSKFSKLIEAIAAVSLIGAGLLFYILGGFSQREAASIGIIGEPDLSTAYFIAGEVGYGRILAIVVFAVGIIGLMVSGVRQFSKR